MLKSCSAPCSLVPSLSLQTHRGHFLGSSVQTLYNAQLENACSEQGARMSAMDSSSRNASDMLGRLTLSYNRCENQTPSSPASFVLISSRLSTCTRALGSSRNAHQLVRYSSRLTLVLNVLRNVSLRGPLCLVVYRSRQARITTELIEIISGASALEG